MSFSKKFIALLFLFFITELASEGKEKVLPFDEALTSIRSLHVKFIKSISDGKTDERTIPILFVFLNTLAETDLQRMDQKHPKTKEFNSKYSEIKNEIQDVNEYLQSGGERYINLIDSYLPAPVLEYPGEKIEIGNLLWQSGVASRWEDCPIEPGYSALHSETLCAMDPAIADAYCKKYGGRLPSIGEFEKAYKSNPEMIDDSRWPKYWTSSKKNGKPAHIGIGGPPGMKKSTDIGNTSQSSVRCVWTKIK